MNAAKAPQVGSYKFYAYATIAGMESEQVKTPFTVKIVDQAPERTVKVSAKGSIDVLNRDTTSVVCTPKLKNITGEIEDVSLAGSAAHLFRAELDDGRVIVSAKSDAALVTKYNYRIKLKLTLDTGYVLTTGDVKLKVTQSKPKVTVSPKQAVVFNCAAQSQTTVLINAQNKDGTPVTAESIVLTNMTDVFSYDAVGQTLTLKDRGAVAKGKTCTLKFELRYAGCADNEKPVTVSCKVKVQ
jgi:hypothetical protein